ncbi:hypothetical protein [Rhodoferax sp. OV413]|uniref:hypothetical protein n=1 Tax=Rhodoferax sp. OV413 TaxID=1855285 RepID=UPI00116002C3|nr:hypothetical protein [Rhodoferax sp. OV413]
MNTDYQPGYEASPVLGKKEPSAHGHPDPNIEKPIPDVRNPGSDIDDPGGPSIEKPILDVVTPSNSDDLDRPGIDDLGGPPFERPVPDVINPGSNIDDLGGPSIGPLGPKVPDSGVDTTSPRVPARSEGWNNAWPGLAMALGGVLLYRWKSKRRHTRV